MAHVQAAGHVRRRNYHAEGLSRRIGVGLEHPAFSSPTELAPPNKFGGGFGLGGGSYCVDTLGTGLPVITKTWEQMNRWEEGEPVQEKNAIPSESSRSANFIFDLIWGRVIDSFYLTGCSPLLDWGRGE